MPWFIVGFVVITFATLPLYIDLTASSSIEYLYYISLGALFNLAWSATQVSHMSLVPSLTPNRERRVCLSLFRINSTI